MNTLIEIINMQWVSNIGWSLLHSLWQGALIILITIGTLRFIPVSKSNYRYAVSLAAMVSVIILFIGTFLYLEISSTSNLPNEQTFFLPFTDNPQEFVAMIPESIPSMWAAGVAFLNVHMNKILAIWLFGVALLFTRLIGSFWYIEKIRSNSTMLTGTVLEKLNQLAYQLQIPRWIDLAENSSIHSPLVIGVIKPIILVPAGMITGLSMEQIESIFIHELTHIKRHDYLVNILQSIVEVILFFNPFVLILSNILRRERENCCDDVVIEQLKNPALYARTLAQLEEYKHTSNQLAISFSGNKNYLLNRIKRIMEHTAKKQNGKGWLLPIILVVIGLTSASWLSFTPSKNLKKGITNIQTPVPDTIIAPPVVVPPIELVAPVDLEPMLMESIELMLDEPVEIDMDLEPVELMLDQAIDLNLSIEPMIVHMLDTIPEVYWEKFGENFSDTYNEKYAAKMMAMKESMRALEETLSKLQHEELISQEVQEKLQRLEKIQMEKLHDLEKLHQTELMEVHQKKLREVEEKMRAVEKIQQEKFVRMEEKMRAFEKVMSAYEKELKEELVKDGYIKKDDEVTIRWRDEDLEINGTKIKEKDKEKYKALQRKYFKGGSMQMNWE